MSQGVHKITEEFEKEVASYTGAPFAVAVDNASNALFLSLMYENIKGKVISIPCRTYPSVPCEIIHAGGKVKFEQVDGETITGSYQLKPSRVYDSSLSFTADMYITNTLMCLSFTGAHKRLKLSKAGMILTDDVEAVRWLKRARFSGRRECSYHEDNFDMLGWNFYLMPEISARGLLLMQGFYNLDGTKKHFEDITMKYPDLSNYKIYYQ